MTQQFITRRKGSSCLYLRILIPTALHASVGKKEVLRSLKTADPILAEQRATKIRAELYAEWSPSTLPAAIEADRGLPLSIRPDNTAMIREANKAGYELHFKNLAVRRHEMAHASREDFAKYKKKKAEAVELYAQQLATMNLEKWKPIADRLIELRGWHLEREQSEYIEFVRLIAEAFMDASRSDLELDEGRPAPQPTAPVVIAARKLQSETAATGEMMMELFELYGSQRVNQGLKRPAGIKQDRMVVELFSSFVGAQRSVASITAAEARDFRNILNNLPINFGKRKEFAGLGLREIAVKNCTTAYKTLKPVTQARYLSTLSPFFSWLKSEVYIENQPFDGLHQRFAKHKNPRPPFSTEQFNVILKSPLYAGFEQTGKEHLQGSIKTDDWRYWFPLICMLTGARAAEVAQLRVDNINQEFGVWMITFTEDDSTNQKIKNHKTRVVAVHTKLIQIGLLAFRDQQAVRATKDNCSFLFPELVVGPDEQFGDRPARWFREYLVRIGMKTDGDGLGAHSFRHAMTDELRKADYSNEEIGAKVLGHSNSSVTSGYGIVREGTAAKFKEIIDAAKFEGVDFTQVYR